MSEPACSIEGCTKRMYRKTWCRMHYTRWQRHGDPSITLKNGHRRTMAEVMSDYVPDRPDGGCWKWRGSIDKNGYGQFNQDGFPRRAHRLAYEHFIGPIPAGLLLMHSCDNRPCVNPAHLSPGTDADNLGDMARKGRSARGEKHRAAKLTAAQVMEARVARLNGTATVTELAARYGITPTPMSQAIRGVTWKHLPQPEEAAK